MWGWLEKVGVAGKGFNVRNKRFIPRALVGTVGRFRRTCGECGSSPRFITRLSALVHRCTNEPSLLCCTRGVAGSLNNTGVCLGHRSLGRANSRGLGGYLNRYLLTGEVNGAEIVTRANTNRRNITATAMTTLLKLRYRVFVNGRSAVHRTLGICEVGLLNTGIGTIRANAVALGSTMGRTVHR